MIFSYQLLSELSNQEDTLVEGELSQIQLNLNSMINTANNLASTYFSDKDMAWALETYSGTETDTLEDIRNIDSQIVSDQMVHPFIQKIQIYFENKNLFDTSYAHKLSISVKQLDWYINYATADHSTYLGVENAVDSPHIILIRKLNLLKFESNNILKLDLSPDIIQTNLDSELLAKSDSNIYLVNPEDQVVVSNINNSTQTLATYKKTSKNHLFVKAFADDSLLKGWKIEVISDRSLLYSALSNKIIYLVLTFIIILSITMIMFYGLAHSIITRLEYIAKIMDQSKNDELAIIDISMGNDEIGVTAQRYNNMIQRIKLLMGENSRTNDVLQATNEELLASLEEIETQEKTIQELVYLDKLTDLDNRFAITRFIDNQLLDMNDQVNFSVGFLDIDNFKLINDTYGHDIGDEIIKQIGTRLKTFENDLIHIGRFGGDEFIITVKDFIDLDQLNSIHQTIRTVLREPISANDISFALTISMGVSLYAVHSKRRHELIKLADIALYKAKELGRDQVVLFENSMNQALSEKLMRQALIREAIKEKQFILYYQPFHELKTHTLKGCEALLRWKPTCDLQMNTQEVIQNIEEMGLMLDVGEWILIEACLFAQRINKDRTTPLVVSINISALQLMHSNFLDRFMEIILTYQINIQYISLEMTESILMNSIEKGTSLIRSLRDSGISISLDDFGTGYSSLKYFKELPITILKIDKSFIDQITTNEYDEQLVDTMIQLAHNKKVQVIAEGVETQDQLDLLQKMDCDMVQGYYFSKAISDNDMMKRSLQTMEG